MKGPQHDSADRRSLERRLLRERRLRLEAEATVERDKHELAARRQEHLLLESVEDTANRAHSVGEAATFALERICRFTQWSLGHFLFAATDIVDGHVELVSTHLWYPAESPEVAALREETEEMHFSPGVELPGRALEIGRPCRVTALADEQGFRRRDAALAAGLTATFAFPILVGTEVVAAVEFFAKAAPTLDESTFDAINRACGQLGRVIERQRSERRLADESTHPLTQLPNRAALLDQLARRIKRTERDPSYLFALLFVDLDGFKAINATRGHATGDQVLAEISSRLYSLVRPHDIVARFGGDEFVVLIDHLQTASDAVRVGARMQQVLGKPIALEDNEIIVGASIGIATSATGYTAPEEMLRDADTAMRRAKGLEENRLEVFDRSIHQQAVASARHEADLQQALDRGEFRVLYQPVVALSDGHLVGCEALLRWQHPIHGLIGPEYFLKFAEESGFVRVLGEWILDQTCAQLGDWQRRFPHARALTASVNLSARQLPQPDLAERLAAILARHKPAAGSLCLELTESATLEPCNKTAQILTELKSLGVKLVLDDFGTGYASFSSLLRLPMDSIKIDRSFVERIDRDQECREVVKTILTLAQNLKLGAIAEGVETFAQAHVLQELPCKCGQGYLFSPPVEARVFEGMVASREKLGPPAIRRPRRKTAKATVASAQERTVLIVDDDEQVLRMLGRWVTEAGMHTVTCRTFDEAKRRLGSLPPDVLLTDIRLAGSNGLELVARSHEKYPEVSNVVLTAFDDPVLRRDADMLHAQFLVKPIRRQDLLAAVSTPVRES